MSNHSDKFGLREFLTAKEIELDRQRRKDEWERVRTPADPIEAPDEVFDTRSLYEKLREQHEKRRMTFEDQYAQRNMIRGLDEEEAHFLTQIDRVKFEQEKKIRAEENIELEQFRKALVMQKEPSENKIKFPVITESSRVSQHHLLASAVKRKGAQLSDDGKKKCISSTSDSTRGENKSRQISNETAKLVLAASGLPGLGFYSSSSDSESSNEDVSDQI